MIPRDKRGRFCRLAGQHVRVYRLEHVACQRVDRHGPASGCAGFFRPPFGWRGGWTCPDGARGERCGATASQVPYWWDREITPENLQARWQHWRDNGWAFIAYDVPLEEVREVDGQVVFTARDEYRMGYVRVEDLPEPLEHHDTVQQWHNQHYGKRRQGRALLAA